MSTVAGITPGGINVPQPIPWQAHQPTPPGEAVTSLGWPRASVDFNGLTVGEALARLEEPRLEQVRRQITAGTYLSEKKLETVADRLIALLRRLKDQNERAMA